MSNSAASPHNRSPQLGSFSNPFRSPASPSPSTFAKFESSNQDEDNLSPLERLQFDLKVTNDNGFDLGADEFLGDEEQVTSSFNDYHSSNNISNQNLLTPAGLRSETYVQEEGGEIRKSYFSASSVYDQSERSVSLYDDGEEDEGKQDEAPSHVIGHDEDDEDEKKQEDEEDDQPEDLVPSFFANSGRPPTLWDPFSSTPANRPIQRQHEIHHPQPQRPSAPPSVSSITTDATTATNTTNNNKIKRKQVPKHQQMSSIGTANSLQSAATGQTHQTHTTGPIPIHFSSQRVETMYSDLSSANGGLPYLSYGTGADRGLRPEQQATNQFNSPLLEEPEEDADPLEIMCDHIYKIGVKRKWFQPLSSSKTTAFNASLPPQLAEAWNRDKKPVRSNRIPTSVSIRASDGTYKIYPPMKQDDELGNDNDDEKGGASRSSRVDEFQRCLKGLNAEIVAVVRGEIVESIMREFITAATASLPITPTHHLQSLPHLTSLPYALFSQYAAFVHSEGCLVVWADDVDLIEPTIEDIIKEIRAWIWEGQGEKMREQMAAFKENYENTDIREGIESGEIQVEPYRQYVLMSPGLVGASMILCLSLISLGLRTLIREYYLDGGYLRFALMGCSPLLFVVTLFACSILCNAVFQILGPVGLYNKNTHHYSGKRPSRDISLALLTENGALPTFTVQLPLYKEGLETVIMPTVASLKKAIRTYERQGGSVNILVCDDGFGSLSDAEKARRRKYYYDNNMAFISRPPHSATFIRKGRFKKASNLNFACALSLRTEELLDELRPQAVDEEDEAYWYDEDENELYQEALAQAIGETQGRATAEGNIRIGEFILIIDSDTRVPEDCFMDAAYEMTLSPSVAILQHDSEVMQVAGHYFENGITYFTRRVNKAISMCCANGDNVPFVGHNAFLRWKAVQEVAFVDEEDGFMKIWSESHVSEDFDMALRLQIANWTLRWASYSDGGFKEGVSLTCVDELNRWQKYAYGVSELIFHPLRYWIFRGPFTPLFRKFIWCNMQLHCKISTIAYLLSYYAIGCSFFMTILNYWIVGFDLLLDSYYLNSWRVTLSCIAVFTVVGNIAYVIFAFRLKIDHIGNAIGDALRWGFFFVIFFSGISFHVTSALLAHLFGYNMQWSSTVKEVEASNFFQEVPSILKRFWATYILMFTMMIGVILFSTNVVPKDWQIHSIEAIFPMCLIAMSHILYPIALNPWLMHFQF